MSHPVGNASAVEELARTYRREAQRIEDLAGRVSHRSRRTHWVGKRAHRSRSLIERAGRDVGDAAQELRSMAKNLDAHARWVRDTIAELEDLERRIRWWASAHPPDPTTPGPDASWIGWWPGRHEFAWRDLASRLWSAGAWF